MSQTEPFDDNDPESQEEPSGLRRRLADVNRQKNELQAQLDSLKTQQARDSAFTSAALPDGPMTKFFQQHYDGEASSEAIRQAAMEHGLIGATDANTQAQVDQIAQQSQALSGAQGAVNPSTQAAYDAELEDAARISSYAVADVQRKYGRPVA